MEQSLTNRSRSMTYCNDFCRNTDRGTEKHTRRECHVVKAATGNWVALVPREIELSVPSSFVYSVSCKVKSSCRPGTVASIRFRPCSGLNAAHAHLSGFNKRNSYSCFFQRNRTNNVFNGSKRIFFSTQENY